MNKVNLIKCTTDLSAEMIEARKQWNNRSKKYKEKSLSTTNHVSHAQNLKTNTFSDKQNLALCC